ncbi:unnamed protein product, partial [Effrenium voratum]
QPERKQAEQTQPEQTQPERTPPERKQPEQKQPERTPPERKQPEQTQPERTPPERKHPEQTQPERTPPERKHPEQKQPERTPLERKQAEQKQPLEEVKEPARRHDVLAVSGDFASIDVRACRRTLQALLAELPTPRCAISQLALATADQLLSDAGESDEGVAFAKLTAAGSVLDLMAVMNKCSHLLKVSLAVRGVLSAVAVLQEEWLLQPLLEPVVAPAFLAATAAQAATAPLPGGACELLQHCALLACDESEHSQRLLCAASCGFLNVCRALAMEAAYSQADRLLLQEAQCRVRAAAAKAARAAAAELKSELAGEAEPSTSAKPTGRESAIQAAVDAAASEADRQCKELDALRGEILSGRRLLQRWDALAKAVRCQPPISPGRTMDVLDADWERMEDGMHLNDSLLNLFMSSLVGLLGGSRIHAFSSHFFTMLAGPDLEVDVPDGWQRVKTWTRAVRRRFLTGIFACDYLLLPLHHEAERHWSLAVVCRPWACIDLASSVTPSYTTIAFLDSLRAPGSQAREEAVVKTLRQYLQCEWSDCGEAGCFRPERVKAVPIHVPQQPNDFDCGIYVLEFVLQLLQRPWRLTALGKRPVNFQVSEPRPRWRRAAQLLRGEGRESRAACARHWLKALADDQEKSE